MIFLAAHLCLSAKSHISGSKSIQAQKNGREIIGDNNTPQKRYFLRVLFSVARVFLEVG
jgi:hypothetical protein